MDNGEMAAKLYARILETANLFLRNANMFEISALQDHDPSYEELAKIMSQLADIIGKLIEDEEPMLAQKSIDYVTLMMNMALAIRNDQPKRLSQLADELNKKPFM